MTDARSLTTVAPKNIGLAVDTPIRLLPAIVCDAQHARDASSALQMWVAIPPRVPTQMGISKTRQAVQESRRYGTTGFAALV